MTNKREHRRHKPKPQPIVVRTAERNLSFEDVLRHDPRPAKVG